MASSDSQIDKPQCGCPKRAELLDVNINTGMQSINTERTSLRLMFTLYQIASVALQKPYQMSLPYTMGTLSSEQFMEWSAVPLLHF